MSNIVLINASGIGSRFGSDIPKQFHNIKGRPILYYCLHTFQENELVDDIYVITMEDSFKYVEDICMGYNINKFRGCIKGGRSANESRYNGLKGIHCKSDDLIIMHDAVRICIKDKTVTNLIKLGLEYGHGVCGQILNANIYVSNVDDSVIDMNIPSKGIFLNSMPFICKHGLLLDAFNKGVNDLNTTAGPMGVLSTFGNIKVFPKIEVDFIETLKVTYKEDINFIEKLLN